MEDPGKFQQRGGWAYLFGAIIFAIIAAWKYVTAERYPYDHR
jgi:hypothetical protein